MRCSPSFLTLSVLSFMAASNLLADEPKQIYRDKKTDRHMYVCSEEKGLLMVAESCGKYWDRYTRKREELALLQTEYKEIKKGQKVMIPVKKDGEMTWTLGTVSFIYEDGQITVMEYYTNPGPTGGTTSWTMSYDYIAKAKEAPLSAEKEVCAKEDFEVGYGPANKRKYTFEKGQKLTAHEFFNNGMVAVSYQGFMKNFFSYGTDSKIPIPQNKIEACASEEKSLAVDDGKRVQKPAVEEEKIVPHSNQTISK